MNGSRRYIGSSAFLNSARRGSSASQSASQQPANVLETLDRGADIGAQMLAGELDIAPGELVTQLMALERLGLVRSTRREGGEVVYGLTDTGKKARRLAYLAVA